MATEVLSNPTDASQQSQANQAHQHEQAGHASPGSGLLVLVDGHALVFRAFHAVPASFITSRGEPTNAVYGFTSTILKVVSEYQPEFLAVTFDRSTPTFRHLASADYKATRPRAPDELRRQFGRVREVVEAFGIPIYECEGYEADDVLGGLAQQAERVDVSTIIVTGDLDSLQLVTKRVRVLTPKGRLADTMLYDVAAVQERYGLEPRQIPDLKALAGDASDNIKGVPGVGPKTAARLLSEHGTVEVLYAHLDDLSPKQRALLDAHRDLVERNKRLATIQRDVPCVLDLERCRFGHYDRERVLKLFQELEFRSLLDRLPRSTDAAASVGAGKASAAAAGTTTQRFAAVDGGWRGSAGDTARGPVYGKRTVQEHNPRPDHGEGTPTRNEAGRSTDLLVITGVDELERAIAELSAAVQNVVHPAAHQRSVIDFDLAGIAVDSVDQSGEWQAWYVPVTAAGGEGLPEQAVIDRFRAVLEDAQVPKVAHDAKALYTLLAQRGVTLRGLTFDTMIASYLLNPASRSLTVRELAFQQWGQEMVSTSSLAPKGQSILVVPVDQIAEAAMAEAALVGRAARRQRDDLAERAQLELYQRVELPLIPVLAAMERAGIKVDVSVLAEMSRELAQQIQVVEVAAYNAVGHQFAINSPQQLAKVLVDELHLPLTKRTKTGYSTDATVLEELLGTHPVIEQVLQYRQLTKLKSTYVDALPALVNPRTGRVHTTFNQAVAATGRLSSEAPNLQNIPIRTEVGRQIRRAFVAGAPDSVLFSADYAQIELRIAAHITRDPLLIEAFEHDEDIHTSTAATVFGVPASQVTPEQRRLAKTTNFAVLYGISDFGLSQRVGIARSEAAPFIKAYLDRYEGIRHYIERTIREARQRGYVETPLGRRRYLPELKAQNAAVRSAGERAAINMPIQGAQADLIKLAMITIHGEMERRQLRAQMLLQVHDELVFEVPETELDELARMVAAEMEGAMKLIVPIKVEMKVGKTWSEMRSFHA